MSAVIYFVNNLAKEVIVNLHSSLRAEFLTAEALDALTSVNLRKAVFAALYHGNSLGRAGFIALFAAYALILFNKGFGVKGNLQGY